MTLEDELLKEIRLVDSEYNNQLALWDNKRLVTFTYLENKRDAALDFFAEEFADIDELKGVLDNINDAPVRLEDLNARLADAKEELVDTKSALRSERKWHVARYIGSVAALVGVPLGVISVGYLIMMDYPGDTPPTLMNDASGCLAALFTLIALPAGLAGVMKGIEYYCKDSMYKEDVLELKENISKSETELKSLENQIAVTLQDIKKSPEPIKHEIADLQTKYDKKVGLLRQEFDRRYDEAQQKYDDDSLHLKEEYTSSRRKLVDHLEHLRQQVPDLSLQIPTKAFVENKYALAYFKFHNKGVGKAKDIYISIDGFYEGDKEDYIRELKPDETEELEMSIKPTEYGNVKWSVKAEYKDVLGRPRSHSWKYFVEVIAKPGTPSTVVVGRDYIGRDRTSIEDSVLHRSQVK